MQRVFGAVANVNVMCRNDCEIGYDAFGSHSWLGQYDVFLRLEA